MEHMLSRSAAYCNPGGGLLLAEHFQMAYVTTDMERALEMFKMRFGIQKFSRLEGQMPAGGQIRAEFAWVGTIMYELICASGPGSDIYMDRLPRDDSFHIKHHHLGFLLRSREQWDACWSKPGRSAGPFRIATKIRW